MKKALRFALTLAALTLIAPVIMAAGGESISKDSVYLKVSIQPESAAYLTESGNRIGAGEAAAQKNWHSSAFRFEMGSIESDNVSETYGLVGGLPARAVEPSGIEYPNLTFYIPEVEAQGWDGWVDEFVIRGNCSASAELDGQISFLAPDHKTVLRAMDFEGVCIVPVASDSSEANSDGVNAVEIELYVQKMKLSAK
jgi:hypothetical protein